MDAARWVTARELGPDDAWNQLGTALPLDQPLLVGREGDLPLGVDPEDSGVSRVALTVTGLRQGWQIDVSNRGGAWIHPWGLAAGSARPHQSLDWPLIGVRVLCPVAAHQHWVLLESRIEPDAEPPVLQATGSTTSTAEPPKPLTAAETSALSTVFAELLVWPPRPSATPLQLKQAATRLRISGSAVQERLNGAREKARRLGLDRPVRLTDPDYLHVLVGAGYLAPAPLDPSQRQPG